MTKTNTITEQLRRLILEAEVSRYILAKATGVGQDTLSMFVNGKRGLSMEALDAIGAYFDIRLVRGAPRKAVTTKTQQTGKRGGK